jgi:hypothetical protein
MRLTYPDLGRGRHVAAGAMPRETKPRLAQCANIDGLSLHASVLRHASDRRHPEQLLRYITCPGSIGRARAVHCGLEGGAKLAN